MNQSMNKAIGGATEKVASCTIGKEVEKNELFIVKEVQN